MGCKVRQDGLQSAAGIAKCDGITKGDGTEPPAYIHCLIVKFIISKLVLQGFIITLFSCFSLSGEQSFKKVFYESIFRRSIYLYITSGIWKINQKIYQMYGLFTFLRE